MGFERYKWIEECYKEKHYVLTEEKEEGINLFREEASRRKKTIGLHKYLGETDNNGQGPLVLVNDKI